MCGRSKRTPEKLWALSEMHDRIFLEEPGARGLRWAAEAVLIALTPLIWRVESEVLKVAERPCWTPCRTPQSITSNTLSTEATLVGPSSLGMAWGLVHGRLMHFSSCCCSAPLSPGPRPCAQPCSLAQLA
jgi:hypothetical protein